MPFYTITIVTTVDATGKPMPSTDAGKKAVRQVQVWDERSHGQLHPAP
ncbi:MAG: hypothetical protein P0Y65_05950 [Candidatus Devosia phytovorans]|uniref:Uncharacterized protein n=1 Tax=Candidatus Devosia phytovorans TaxID=3121372 RepID=A0AAJ6B2T5_9HYPH|nr:hypothetical protein [Devosia sp.]WEK05798.1 MAG: hypothetical protein P0Y65_05950 [Devosia sp.]